MTVSRRRKCSDEDIVASIAKYTEEHGYLPGVRDVAAGVGLTVGPMHERLRKLRDKGVIAFEDRVPRSIRIVRKDGDSGHTGAD